MQGIPSNLGILKAYCQKQTLSLSKGKKSLSLNLPFSMERIIGAIVYYGGYVGSQAMMNETGNYTSNYGISYIINKKTKMLEIYSSGDYSERDLDVIIFYI